MSYCRFLEGDVYIFFSGERELECCACALDPLQEPWGFFKAKSTQEMVDHLEEHKKVGHFIPWGVVEHLWDDDKENFPV